MIHNRYELGAALRKLRKNKGLSQEAVAKAAGIGRSTLVHLENGADARLSKIAAVARFLGADIEAVAESSDLAARRQARLQQAIRVQSLQQAHLRIALDLMVGKPATIKALKGAREMVELWERKRVCSPFYIDAWKRVLKGTAQEVGKALSRIDEKWAPALLQNTPFGPLVRQRS